jgi:hypothetical protein
MGFGKHKHTGMDKTISGGGGYEGIYFLENLTHHLAKQITKNLINLIITTSETRLSSPPQ